LLAASLAGLLAATTAVAPARADGLVVPPRAYEGSLAERAQEALILFHPGDEGREATEDLILKIRVEGDARDFAWVVPLPNEPITAPEDPALFEDLYRYVQARLADRRPKTGATGAAAPKAEAPPAAAEPVEVLSRKTVGSFDVAVVRENKAGALDDWLDENGYKSLEDADDLIGSYREKGYVFACVRVSDAATDTGQASELHPLRFSFSTGGRDGVYFPMRLTGLQSGPFDVNLYVLHGKWLNDRLNRFGYAHRGFELVWRDFDGPECRPNAGKLWSDPPSDPYLRGFARHVPAVTRLVQKLHPGEPYYLTNIRAQGLRPADVRAWSDDLWLFPYYTDRRVVPLDARPGGPASAAYPAVDAQESATPGRPRSARIRTPVVKLVTLAAIAAVAIAAATRKARRRSAGPGKSAHDPFA
jgi:hypothetical protein